MGRPCGCGKGIRNAYGIFLEKHRRKALTWNTEKGMEG